MLAVTLGLVLVSLLIVVPLGEAATTRAVSDRYLDRPSSLLAAYSAAWGRLGALITMICILILGYAGSFAVVIALAALIGAAGAGGLGALLALLAFLALIPVLILVYVRTVVAVPAIVLERVSGWGGLKRSWQLISGRFWPTFGRMLLLVLITSIISGVVSTIFQVPGNLDLAQQQLCVRAGRRCDRSGVRGTGHLHRGDAALLRHPHSQGRLRYRDARAVTVRRLVASGVIAAALVTVTGSTAAPARAAAPCVTLEYLTLLGRADAALTTVPSQPAAALTAVTQAQDIAPSSSPDLAPVIAALAATPPDVNSSRQRITLIVTTLALPSGSACNVNSREAENLLHQVYASSVFADLDQNQPPSIFARIGAAIQWILSHLFGALGQGGSILLGLLVLGAIVAFVVYRSRCRRHAARARADEPATAGDDPEREWTLALAAAARRLPRGDSTRLPFGTARCRRPTRSSRSRVDDREMLATLTADTDLLAVVAPAASSFDNAWYGGKAVGAAEWEVARTRCEAVRRVARRSAGASNAGLEL